MESSRKWLKGDTHLHTINSDGELTPEQLIQALQKKGLDWAIITDHNYPAADSPRMENDLLLIQGEEVTGRGGHFNVWGIKMPVKAPYKLTLFEDFLSLIDIAKEAGGVVSVNHPFCKNHGWHFPIDDVDFDCAEIWNAPMHFDDLTNIKWWHNRLLEGKRIAAVGGSDYHKDFVITDLLAMPTTFVYAKSNTQQDILDALKCGHSFITQGPEKTRLYITCGEAFPGCEVEWAPGMEVNVKAERIKRGHRLIVYNNNLILADIKAKKFGTLETKVAVEEKGFVRAQVIYEFKPLSRPIYRAVLKKVMPKDLGNPILPFVYCFTNPIFFS